MEGANDNRKSFFSPGRLILFLFVLLIILSILTGSLYLRRKAKLDLITNNKNSSGLPPSTLEINREQEALKVIEGKDGILTVITLPNGTIEGDIKLNKETQINSMPISFTTVADKKVTFDLILGALNNRILTLIIKEETRPEYQDWIATPVSDLQQILKKGNKIELKIYYQKDISAIIEKDNCDLSCLGYYKFLVEYYENNIKVIQILKDQSIYDNNLEFGPPAELAIYTK